MQLSDTFQVRRHFSSALKDHANLQMVSGAPPPTWEAVTLY